MDVACSRAGGEVRCRCRQRRHERHVGACVVAMGDGFGDVEPVGYLYRVGQSAARRYWRSRRGVVFADVEDRGELDRYDDGLFDALGGLNHEQRVAVLLVHGYGYSYADVADVLGVSVTAVTNHVHRGPGSFRKKLGGRR